MAQAQQKQGQPVNRRLGDLLVADGLLNPAQLHKALGEQRGTTEKLGAIVINHRFFNEQPPSEFASRQYGGGVGGQDESGTKGDVLELKESADEAPVVKLVNMVLVDAIQKGASDIPFETYEKVFRIRFRMDGVLHEMLSPPKRLESAILSRLKIMSNLDIAERRLPQDGRIKLRYNTREIDFRVSTLPTIFGEKAVLRILDKDALQ